MGELAELLAEARAAGLLVVRDGELLDITGPKSAEPIALRLLERKAVVLAALDAERDEVVAEVASHRVAWAGALVELGEALGWPNLPYRAGHSLPHDRGSWIKFSRTAVMPNLVLAVTAIREQLNPIESRSARRREGPTRCR